MAEYKEVHFELRLVHVNPHRDPKEKEIAGWWMDVPSQLGWDDIGPEIVKVIKTIECK